MVASTLDAEPVLAVGLPGTVAVLNVCSAPFAVPNLFVATIRNT